MTLAATNPKDACMAGLGYQKNASAFNRWHEKLVDPFNFVAVIFDCF